MFRTPLARTLPGLLARAFSTTPRAAHSLPLQIHGTGSGTVQTITVPGKAYTIATDTYTVLGGGDASPSPVSYALASLSSCNQVTGFVVAKDHGIAVGRWDVKVDALLPTAVLVGGAQGNPNFEEVTLTVKVQTDAKGKDFEHFAAEVDRRCPITQLFRRSGVVFKTEWVNEALF
ncbi:OsmC/Ohr family [Lasiosphaeris hirsuta]|uniref:OsmC/Ohr family n=1 Tax=Lasiosphaeris hirsuta TaxID=260670 RepID=A0AA40DQF2_9PEZI|nr:OsmC/Ohr family [Lasiosphaeris hirsuta]